jgi:asparagine synthase (glutamine-hydrolysing)
MLPRQVVDRPKRGFTFPFQLWLKGALRHDMEDVLLDSTSDLLSGINRGFVAEVWNDFLVGKTTWSRPWSLYVLKRWVEGFMESGLSRTTVDISELAQRQAMARVNYSEDANYN